MVALRQYCKCCRPTDQIELHFIDEVRPGYFWIFPTDDNRANIGIGMGHSDIKNKAINLKKVLAKAIESPAFKARFADARPLEKPIGWNLPVSSKRRTTREWFPSVGDAASLIDPFTGEGIGNALCSASTAIETAVSASRARIIAPLFYDNMKTNCGKHSAVNCASARSYTSSCAVAA